jgi:hypothetical protein
VVELTFVFLRVTFRVCPFLRSSCYEIDVSKCLWQQIWSSYHTVSPSLYITTGNLCMYTYLPRYSVLVFSLSLYRHPFTYMVQRLPISSEDLDKLPRKTQKHQTGRRCVPVSKLLCKINFNIFQTLSLFWRETENSRDKNKTYFWVKVLVTLALNIFLNPAFKQHFWWLMNLFHTIFLKNIL